ncbi:hypothetical protein L7F22_013518 [Adiantum nelumboides]|nr:hypothetical protein [Adiantum nelumboides]
MGLQALWLQLVAPTKGSLTSCMSLVKSHIYGEESGERPWVYKLCGYKQTSGSNKGFTHYLHELGNAVRICEVSRRRDGSFSTTLKFMRCSVKDGKFMVGCLNYPHCRNAVWLPNALLEASVSAEICTTCGPGGKQQQKPMGMYLTFQQTQTMLGKSSRERTCSQGLEEILKPLGGGRVQGEVVQAVEQGQILEVHL